MSDPRYHVKIFADGASSNNQDAEKRVGGTGVVVFIKDTSLEKDNIFKKEISNTYPGMTNNRAELTAIKEGLVSVTPESRKDCKVEVITDSNLCVQTFNTWIEGWKKKGWRKSDKSTPENLDIIREIYEELKPQFAEVTFAHIKNDKGNDTNPLNKYNNRADELAYTAAGSSTR